MKISQFKLDEFVGEITIDDAVVGVSGDNERLIIERLQPGQSMRILEMLLGSHSLMHEVQPDTCTDPAPPPNKETPPTNVVFLATAENPIIMQRPSPSMIFTPSGIPAAPNSVLSSSTGVTSDTRNEVPQPVRDAPRKRPPAVAGVQLSLPDTAAPADPWKLAPESQEVTAGSGGIIFDEQSGKVRAAPVANTTPTVPIPVSTLGTEGKIDMEKIRGMNKLKDIIWHMIQVGVPRENVLGECEKLKGEIAIVDRLGDLLSERVARTLDMLLS